MVRCLVPVVFGALLVLASQTQRPLAQAADPSCDIVTAERMVAVGDVHGAYDGFVAILRAAGLVNNRDRWSGGRAVLIQTGDVLDRGAASRRVLDLLRRLERDAAREGGRVYPLLGNHEFMRMVGDWRYVSTGELDAFKTGDSVALRDAVYRQMAERASERARIEKAPFDANSFREAFFKEVPLGRIEMQQAFSATGDYGAWLRARRAVIKVNGIVFLHGGLSEEVAALGCAGINETITREMKTLPVPLDEASALLGSREAGPLWYRGLVTEPEETFAPVLDGILRRMDARAIVVGHSAVPGRIAPRFGGRVVQIDSGMLGGTFYPGGAPAALEVRGMEFSAIYLDRREPLAVPGLVASP